MFESAKLKAERANHHITDLERQFAQFVGTHPYRVAVGDNPESGRTAIRLVFGQKQPVSFALTIGDAIHNLRSALDHMTWELIGRDGGTQDRYLKLPTGDDRINFEASCQGIKTTSQAIRDLLKTLEVFPAGKGDAHYRLHLLDNADKHTVLTPIIRAAKVSKMVIHNADGSVATTLIDNLFAGGDTGVYADVWNVPIGGYVEIDNDTKATPSIFLGDIKGVPAGPVFETLSEFRHAVLSAVHIVESSIS